MIAFLTGLLKKINWVSLVSLVVGLTGVIFGLFRNQQAKTATAEAAQQVAEKAAAVEKGNAAARQAETRAVTAAADAAREVASVPDSELDKLGAELGILRKEK